MKKCVYCGTELEDFEKVCPRCKEYQEDHKSTADMYKDAYDEFYKDFYRKMEKGEKSCNAFETQDYHEVHERDTKKRAYKKRRPRRTKSSGCGSKIALLIFVIWMFQFGFIFLKNSDFIDRAEIMFNQTFSSLFQDSSVAIEEAIDYYNGSNGKEQSYQKAYDIFKKFTDDPRADYYRAEMLLYDRVVTGDSSAKNISKGKQLLKKAASENNPEALLYLGYFHMYGDFNFKKDIKKSIEYFERCAENAPKAYFYLGYIYDNYDKYNELKKGKDFYKALALENYKKGWSKDEPYCKSRVAYKFIYESKNNGKDYATGIQLFKESADAGVVYSMYHLGYIYYKGEVIEKDYEKARKLFNKVKLYTSDKETIKLVDKYLKDMEK